MDDLTPYGGAFETTLANLEKVLERWVQTNVSLSIEKCHMMMTGGIMLGHYISTDGIKVDPTKVEVILKIPTPKMQKEVRRFLIHEGYIKLALRSFCNSSFTTSFSAGFMRCCNCLIGLHPYLK